MKKIIIALLVASLAMGGYLWMKPKAASNKAKGKEELNPLTQAFGEKGVKSCAERINQVTSFLGGNSPSGAMLFVPNEKADSQMASTSLEIVGSGNQSAYASASFAPVKEGGCQSVYDAVVWLPKSCDAVAAEEYKDMKAVGKLKDHIKVIEVVGTTRIFLMPAGEGCVSIKKEIIF